MSEDALNRIANALEKLTADPQIEVQAGPPICPNCGQFDPDIEIPATPIVEGKLSSYIVVGTCKSCDKVMYGVIESYSMHKQVDEVELEINSPERKAYLRGEPVRNA